VTQPWILSVFVRTPSLIRAPGLDNPDNWNLEGLDPAGWEGAFLVADAMEADIRRAAPDGVHIERDTNATVQVTTVDYDWFNAWYESSAHADLVVVCQTPERAAPPDMGDLYSFDKDGWSKDHSLKP
jgi:hypothetical protein